MAWPQRGDGDPQDLTVISSHSLSSHSWLSYTVEHQWMPLRPKGSGRDWFQGGRRRSPVTCCHRHFMLVYQTHWICWCGMIGWPSMPSALRPLLEARLTPQRVKAVWIEACQRMAWVVGPASQWGDCVPMIECWGDQRPDAKLRGLCPNATITLILGEGVPSFHLWPTGKIITRLDWQCIMMWSYGYTPRDYRPTVCHRVCLPTGLKTCRCIDDWDGTIQYIWGIFLKCMGMGSMPMICRTHRPVAWVLQYILPALCNQGILFW